jgi:hypothetical protein
MLQAQLHHKVPREFEGMEDVLTSSTIGLLSHLPGSLAASVVAELAHIRIDDEIVQVALWPNYATPPGFRTSAHWDDGSEENDSDRGRTEPDAVLSSPGWLVVVEAKYHSLLDEEYDQLGREFVIGLNEARKDGRNYRLLVLTANTLEPRPAGMSLIEGVKGAIAKAQGDRAAEMMAAVPDSLRWTKWHRLYQVLKSKTNDSGYEPHTRQLLLDACKLLEMHGLVPYDGTAIAPLMRKWQSSGIREEAWASPLVYRSRTMASLKTSWEELMGLDVSGLGTLAWHPYAPATIEDFDLSSLQPIEWQPYQQKGKPS